MLFAFCFSFSLFTYDRCWFVVVSACSLRLCCCVVSLFYACVVFPCALSFLCSLLLSCVCLLCCLCVYFVMFTSSVLFCEAVSQLC